MVRRVNRGRILLSIFAWISQPKKTKICFKRRSVSILWLVFLPGKKLKTRTFESAVAMTGTKTNVFFIPSRGRELQPKQEKVIIVSTCFNAECQDHGKLQAENITSVPETKGKQPKHNYYQLQCSQATNNITPKHQFPKKTQL